MVNRQRAKRSSTRGDGASAAQCRRLLLVRRIRVQRRQPRRLFVSCSSTTRYWLAWSVDGGDQPLAEGVIQRIIDVRHADRRDGWRCRGRRLIYAAQALVLPVAADVGELQQRCRRRSAAAAPVAEGIQRVRPAR